MKNKEIKESINRIKSIVDFYKLNDENNYDYSDDVLISMKILLSYIEQLEKRIYKARKMIFDNYGVLDKYDIELLDDILKGDSDE